MAQNALMLLVLMVTLAACAPSHHTVEPYRSDAASAEGLARRAAQACRGRGGIKLPGRPLISDGCTLWPDGSWAERCGSRATCVRGRAIIEVVGALTYFGVRVGGHPFVPFHWRWGFGRAYPAGYTEK